MPRNIKYIRSFIQDNWRVVLLAISIIGLLGLLLMFKLGSLTGGLSDSELYIQQLVANDMLGLPLVAREAIFLPYTFMLFLLQFTPFTGPTGVRAVGVLFGLMGAAGMFYIFRKWYTTRIAVLGTLLFATSSWFLHTARYANESAAYLLIPLLVASMIALQAKTRSRLAITAVTVLGMAMLYLPGLILFIIPAIIIKRKVIIASLRLQPLWYKIGQGFVALIMLTPLILSLAKPIPGQSTSLENFLTLIGFPGTNVHNIHTMFTTLKENISGIFVYNTSGPVFAPGHMPWFDVCTTVLAIIGIMQFARYRKLDRSKLIAIIGLLSLVLISLGGAVSTVILLPFLFLFVVEGLKWLLETWLEIFPRNPFARSFAVLIVCIITASIMTYHVNKYYLAWARSPETRQVFNNIP